MFTVTISYLTVSNLPWPNILDSHAVFFFITLDFAFTTRCIHNWVSFLLWPSLFLLFGAVYPFFPSITSDTWPGGLIFWCHIFCLFILSVEFSRQEYRSSLPFPSPVDHIHSFTSLIMISFSFLNILEMAPLKFLAIKSNVLWLSQEVVCLFSTPGVWVILSCFFAQL